MSRNALAEIVLFVGCCFLSLQLKSSVIQSDSKEVAFSYMVYNFNVNEGWRLNSEGEIKEILY